MAKTAGKQVSKAVVWVILLLLIVGLAGFGAVNFSGNVRSVGTVGDTPIAVTRYARQLNQDMRAIQAQTGQSLTMTQAQAFGVDRGALQRVVSQTALENEAARIGISVGDAEVQKQLLDIPDFKSFDGTFDAATYKDTLRQSNQSVTEFEDSLRAETARLLLQSAVAAGTQMPDAYTQAIYEWAGQRRSFHFVTLTEADLTDPIREPSDDDLQAFYQANPADFTLPEARDITFAWLTPSMLIDKVSVDEDALRKLYDDRAAQYLQPERRLIERLVFGAADEAAAAWDRLQSGEIDFDALVAERQLTLDDIDLGDVTLAELGVAGPAVFALTEPGLVGPVDSDLGPAILRMNGILAAEETTFEEARPELLDEYAMDRAARMIADQIEQVSDLLAGGATLEELADETDLELGQIDWAPGQEGGIAGYAAFRDTATAVAEGDFPEVGELEDGGIFALRLNKIVPPKLQDFDTVREDVISGWEDAEVMTALNTMADELLPRITGGEDPATFGLNVTREEALTRDAFIADAPPSLITTIFEMTAGEARTITAPEAHTSLVIARLNEILPPDPENTDLVQAKVTYAAQTSQSLSEDILDAFTRTIETQAGIQLDQSAVNAVNAQFQ